VATALLELRHEAILVDPAERSLTEALQEIRPDLCFLTLHGKEGEDGTVQRLLELLDIPYTGTAPFDCEIAFDKVLAKDALRRAGVRTPDWVVVEGWALRDLGAGSALVAVADRIGFPSVVKPSRSGSALGVGFVDREADLPAAVMGALAFSGAAIVESRIEGTEIAAGIIGTPGELLPLVEITPKSGAYDYVSRYTAGATDYFVPARLSAEVATACESEAALAVESLGLRDVTRVDVIVDRSGTPWVLEVNVSPGMTDTSLVPMAAQAAGMSLPELCRRIVESAIARIDPPFA
jgi:D-alanine-D-alanine ligase